MITAIYVSLKFLQNLQRRAFFIHLLVPILKQLGNGTSLLTNALIVEVKHRHYLVSADHHHLAGLVCLIYRDIPERDFLQNTLTHQLLGIHQQFFNSRPLNHSLETRSSKLSTEHEGNIRHSCFQQDVILKCFNTLIPTTFLSEA
jgi:hypothetical protein